MNTDFDPLPWPDNFADWLQRRTEPATLKAIAYSAIDAFRTFHSGTINRNGSLDTLYFAACHPRFVVWEVALPLLAKLLGNASLGNASRGNACGAPGERFAGERFAGAGERFAGAGERFAGAGERFAGAGERFAGAGERFAGAGGTLRGGQAWFSVFSFSRLVYDDQSGMIKGENLATASPAIAIPKTRRMHRPNGVRAVSKSRRSVTPKAVRWCRTASNCRHDHRFAGDIGGTSPLPGCSVRVRG